MTSMVLRDSTLESLTPSVNAPLKDALVNCFLGSIPPLCHWLDAISKLAMVVGPNEPLQNHVGLLMKVKKSYENLFIYLFNFFGQKHSRG
jgi:hypothetical protein